MSRKNRVIAICVAILLGALISRTYAQPIPVYLFDELGNATWNGKPTTPATAISGGGALFDLTDSGISLPFEGLLGQTWGWIEPNSTDLISDVIVFGGIGNGTAPPSNPYQFAYYSDLEATGIENEMADLTSGSLRERFPNAINQGLEIGPEGDNYIEFPITTLPGQTFIMHGVSDVPEPNTLILIVSAAIGLLAHVRRQRRI